MPPHRHFQRVAKVLTVCLASALAITGSAEADVISNSATLPLLGYPYAVSMGTDCFPTAGICATNAAVTLTSVVSSTFNGAGQDIVSNATYAATLTTLGHSPVGSVILTGTMEQEVEGRTLSTETGSWPVDVLALSLGGPVLGHTLMLTLDGANSSTGTTSITPVGDSFSIASFFDIFVELSLDSTPPLQATRGPIHLDATPAPEPASLTLLGLPVVLVRLARYRRASQGR